MAKDTGIIFLDVSTSISEKIKTKPPIKLMSLFFVGLMVFTTFSMVTFITQPANASPPLTGDKAFSNASLYTPYTQTQTGSNPSFNFTISTHGVINVKANMTDGNSKNATSNVIGQIINPAAVAVNVKSVPDANKSVGFCDEAIVTVKPPTVKGVADDAGIAAGFIV